MYVKFHVDGQASLEDAENFRAFKVVCERDDLTVEALAAAYPRLVTDIRDADHLWLDSEAVAMMGKSETCWREQYEGMVEYAKSKGWTRGMPTSIAAHVEWHGAKC